MQELTGGDHWTHGAKMTLSLLPSLPHCLISCASLAECGEWGHARNNLSGDSPLSINLLSVLAKFL